MFVRALIILVGIAVGVPAEAQQTSRMSVFKNQTKVLDGRAAQQYANSVRLKPMRLC